MLTHLDPHQQPLMVNVGAKPITHRTAHARATVWLPPALAALLHNDEITSPKGPVFQTAILAGIMGAKRTGELIPLCHPLPLDDCRIHIHSAPVPASADPAAALVTIDCHVSTHARTGVEMEALTGASIAALTLYDMGKAVSHGIVIQELRLLSKTGGKAPYAAATTAHSHPNASVAAATPAASSTET